MQKEIHLTATLSDELIGLRLDLALSKVFPEHSRSRLQEWIDAGFVQVDESLASKRYKVLGGESININAALERVDEYVAEAMELNIVYDDAEIIVINKPAGLVVHPGSGIQSGTLLNGLLHYDPNLNLIPRAGIIHRLDKDTTGLMVIARTLESHSYLVSAMQVRDIHREYIALVRGVITAGSSINAPIGRHPRHRTRMAVTANGKEALTHYRVIEKFPDMTLLRCQLESGRTHQIRVHMAHIKHPIIGDPVYAGRSFAPKSYSEDVKKSVRDFPRQALHATYLAFHHPQQGELMEFDVPLPEDFENLLILIQQ